jgi:hypothetical protein
VEFVEGFIELFIGDGGINGVIYEAGRTVRGFLGAELAESTMHVTRNA